MNDLIDVARHLPTRPASATLTVNPVELPFPGRERPLQLRVTVPILGERLPVLLLSHGDGPSLYLPSKDGYGPLVSHYASQGFVVIQPTHANSKVAGLPRDRDDAPLFWRMRVLEMKHILDHLPSIERAVPTDASWDMERVAAVGHSMGGQTVGMLTTPALCVVGDADVNPFITKAGPEWYEAAYHDGPGCSELLTLHGVRHGLGGIAGYDAKETATEDPDRLAAVQRMTTAWLTSALEVEGPGWAQAKEALATHGVSLGHVTTALPCGPRRSWR